MINREYFLSRRIFIRLVGLVHFIAFTSLAVQIQGLVGEHGIIPTGETLARATSLFGADRFLRFPTLFWFNSTDFALLSVTVVGAALALLPIFYIAPGPALFSLWLLYLSCFSISVDFLAFQWDEFLLESTLLAALWAPWRIRPLTTGEPPPSESVRLLFKFLLFRLYFMAGVVKLVTSDTVWWDLAALHYYFEVIPLPNPLSWAMHSAPDFIHVAGTFAVLVAHIVFGIFLLAPGRWSLIGSVPNLLLQLPILLTANYGFFNIITMATHVTLLDDDLIRRVCHRINVRFIAAQHSVSSRLRPGAATAVALALIVLACLHIAHRLRIDSARTGLSGAVAQAVTPYRITNFYGPWPGVPRHRHEVIIEGSDDGTLWQEYQFRYKPGPVDRMPAPMLGHLPRLDYLMWFIQFGEFHETHWLRRLMEGMLEGRPEVLGLIGRGPFPDSPPRFVRAAMYEYRFADLTERRKGIWWNRRFLRRYGPTLSRDSPVHLRAISTGRDTASISAAPNTSGSAEDH